MKILHITNDYSGSTVYKNLVKEIDELGIEQTIYHPIRDENKIDINKIDFKLKESKIIYSPILNYTTDRLFFKKKIKKITNDLLQKISIENIECIHAHTWFSDGAVAYEIFKKYQIPYIVAIRNTDLNLFYKYFFHLERYATSILLNAKAIIFISDVYKKRFLTTNLYKKHELQLKAKCIILYNGVDDFWITNVKERKNKISQSKFKLLFIGKFDSGKNVVNLIKAVNTLNKTEIKYSLTLVGGGGNQHEKILKLIHNSISIKFIGSVYEKKELEKLFLDHDLFVMPSKAETFGLVYIEALSQGLPIIDSINEGIYGIYNTIGISIHPNSLKDLLNALRKINDEYDSFKFDPNVIVKSHDWKKIALEYLKLY